MSVTFPNISHNLSSYVMLVTDSHVSFIPSCWSKSQSLLNVYVLVYSEHTDEHTDIMPFFGFNMKSRCHNVSPAQSV